MLGIRIPLKGPQPSAFVVTVGHLTQECAEQIIKETQDPFLYC